jgi:F-type H+-transporting ATPase subunit a
MALASGFSWLALIPAVDHDTLFPFMEDDLAVLHTSVVCLGLLGFAILARIGLEAAKRRPGIEAWTPDRGLTPRNLAELIVELVTGFMGSMLSKKDVKTFFPLISALFVYIFCCNILSILPGFAPPTDSISTNFGMAILVFIVFNVAGLLRDPVEYFKHLWGPVPILGLILFPIEVFSVGIRPWTLSFRLAVNLYADHLVYGIANDLVYVLAFPLMFLAILVSLVQAFVFSLLSTVYLSLALPHEREEHEDTAHAPSASH